MMVGRKVSLTVEKKEQQLGDTILKVENLTVKSKTHGKPLVNNVSFEVKAGEIVCVAGIDGNGQQELVFALAGMLEAESGNVFYEGKNITHNDIRSRGLAHIPEDRHKHGLVLDYNIAYNMILQKYYTERFQKRGFIKFEEMYRFADEMIERYDIRCSQGAHTLARGMSGGNQQKVIIAREISRDSGLIIAVQPTRGLDVGACEYIHGQLVAERSKGKGVLLVSLELEEVMNVSDRILVMFEGKIVANVKPKEVTFQDLGLYMAGAAKQEAA
jgi:simple sugar transport system ATP-binding protein